MHLSFPLSSLSARGCPLACLAALAASATAQIEPNQVVVSRFQGGGGSAPLGGLSVFDLANPGSGVEITGLSPDLTGSTSGSGNVEGSASVLVDRRTGFLVVGEHALPGADTEIHVLYLTGTTVAQDDAYKLGSAPTGGGWVDQMAWLGDDVVFSVRGRALTTGVMTGHLVGVLRPQVGPPGSPGTVTPVPMNPLPVGSVNALAVDEASGTAYFAMFQGGGVPNEIYSVPVPGDGVTPATPTLVATVANGVLNLGMDGEGQLLVGAIGALLRVDVTQSPATVTTLQPIADVNALSVENTSGDVVIAVSGTGTIYTWQPGPSFVTLGNVAGGASGIAIRQSLIPYGPATPGQNSYDWVLAPNAGGAPTVGNLGFGMTVAMSPGGALGIAGLALGETQLPVLGVTLLLEPATLVLTEALLPAAQATVSLPIPSSTANIGLVVYAQTFFLEAAGLASSRALQVTILP